MADAPLLVQVPPRYRVERLLGSGGMGRVYLAYDVTLHRPVALKLLAGFSDDEGRSRLVREARAAAALNHSGICTIYEVGEAEGTPFIAMEFVEGRCLRDRLDEGPLPFDEAVRYGIHAARALAFAHDHGVVHRDFKAANVMIAADGGLKIVDFGLARRHDVADAVETTAASLVAPGTAAGTPYAMAPEQVCGEHADARSDIWALGVLLCEMLSGHKPFDGPTTPELFSSILRDSPAPTLTRVPAATRVVIERCLEKLPERRYQHASHVQAALEATQSSGTAVVRPGLGGGTPWWWAVVAGGLLMVVAVLAVVDAGGIRTRLTGGVGSGAVRLVVLPLANLSGDPRQAYFSDGVTDEVLTRLSRVRSERLTVIPRAGSVRYAPNAPLDQVARDVNANTILRGSAGRSVDRVRVAVELVDTRGQQIWHDVYERTTGDVFALETEIAEHVVSALGITSGSGQTNGTHAHVDPVAYDLFLRGLSHAQRIDEQDVDQAIALFEQSAARDPNFLPTQAYLALTYGNKGSTYRAGEPEWEEKGFAAVRRALALDANAPEAHFAEGMMLWRPSHGFPNREALAEFREALATQPNFDEAWHQHALVLFHVGHLAAAEREIDRVLAINPGNITARFRYGPIYVYQQRFADALAALDRVPPESNPPQWAFQRAWSLLSLNRFTEAGRLIDDALATNPVDQGGVLHAARAMLRVHAGDREGAEADIAEAIRVGRRYLHFHHTAYALGAVYTALGDFDNAQEWIENASRDGFPNYSYFENDIHLAPLRTTPRFRAFLSKLRAEWEHIPGEPD